MKRLVILVTICTILLSLCACEKDISTDTINASASTTESTVPSESTGCNHTYSNATCIAPKICIKCGATEGNELGHSWNEATCSSPKMCANCGTTDGDVTNHNFEDATCSTPKTCTYCKTTEGNALGHIWAGGTCTTPRRCMNCNTAEGSVPGHNWTIATCTAPKTCINCKITEGNALGHSYVATKTPPTCTNQGYTTYTCKCGDSYKAEYINASHKFSKYVCTSCNAIDKSHAYEYLIEYVKQNGNTYGGNTNIDYNSGNVSFQISYSAEYNILSINMSELRDSTFIFCGIVLSSYDYRTTFGDYHVTGCLDASSFTSNSPISYDSYTGPEGLKQDMLELARIMCNEQIDWLSWYLYNHNVGITIYDLGFTSY